MATSSQDTKVVLNELPAGPLYAPSESDSLFSAPMDQDLDEWPTADLKPINGRPQSLAKEETNSQSDGAVQSCQPVELYRLYTALWDNYNKLVADLRRVEDDNCILRSANIHLCQQLQAADRRIVDHASSLAYSEQGFQNCRAGIRTVLDAWETSGSKSRV